MTSLEYLLDPISTEEFFEEYYEKKVLHISKNSPDKFHNYFKESDVDKILTQQGLTFPNTRLVKLNEDLPSKDFTVEGMTVIDVSKVLKLFSEGASIAFSFLHERHYPLKQLCDGLASEFGQRTQANIYCTPPGNSQGFVIHHDNHDVFVLQVSGTKKWHFYESPIELATKDQEFNKDIHFPGKQTLELTIEPGDLLYIPRGIMHAAETTNQKSTHITTGLIGISWQDILKERIDSLMVENVDFRRGFKTEYWKNTNDPEYVKNFDKIIEVLREPKNIDLGLKNAYKLHVNRARTAYNNPLAQAERVHRLTVESEIQIYPNIGITLEVEAGTLTIGLFNKEVELDEMFEPIIQFILDKQKLKVKELTDQMDDESKIEIIKMLVLEGMLEILE